MKKLIQLLEANIQISSLSCGNVKVDNDSSSDKVNENLLKDICKAAKNANVRVTITTAISGHSAETASGNASRHPSGNAVDISLVNETPVKTPSNRGNVDNFVNQLEILGYTKNSESGNPKSVLTFGFPGHDNHVHVSNTEQTSTTSSSGTTSTSGATATGDSPESISTNILNSFIGDTFGKALGLKEQRVNKEIDKIRNLLK
jgi:hypothetical protein